MKKLLHAAKGFHGSDKVSKGKLTGATGDTDYFFFNCPECANGNVMRVLDYGILDEREGHQDQVFKKKVSTGFIMVFQLHCEHCNLTDYVKLDNVGIHRKSVPQKVADEYNASLQIKKQSDELIRFGASIT